MHALVWDGRELRLDTAYAVPPADEATTLVRRMVGASPNKQRRDVSRENTGKIVQDTLQ